MQTRAEGVALYTSCVEGVGVTFGVVEPAAHRVSIAKGWAEGSAHAAGVELVAVVSVVSVRAGFPARLLPCGVAGEQGYLSGSRATVMLATF